MKYFLLFFICITCLPLLASSPDKPAYFWEEIQPEFDSLTQKMEQWSHSKPAGIFPSQTIQQMTQLAETNSNKQMWARLRYWESYNDRDLSQDSICKLLHQAADLCSPINYAYDRARIYMRKAIYLSQKSNYAEAFYLFNSAAKAFHATGDFRLEACAYNNIGNIYFFLNEYDAAISSFALADSIFSQMNLTKEKMECQLLLANIYIKTDRKQEAYELLRPIIEDSDSQSCPPDLRIIALSNYLSCLSDPKQIEYYSEEAYRLALQINDRYHLSTAILNKGWIMLHSGMTDRAFTYARQADASTPEKMFSTRKSIYKLYTSIYEQKHQWDSAFYYQQLFYAYQDSVHEKDVLTDILRIKVKKEIDKQKIQAMLEKQKSQQRMTFVILVGSTLVTLLLVSVYTIYLLKKKMRKEQQMQFEKDKVYIAQLHKEKELIESKNRELSSTAALIMKKNEVLKEILKEIEDEKDTSFNNTLHKKIQSELQFDNTWDSFKLHFDQMHPSFFIHLKERFPKLTDNDLKLCAYICMELNNKQIAEMLLVQSKAILQARYRLKKKMDLPEDTNLNDYLKTIATMEKC